MKQPSTDTKFIRALAHRDMPGTPAEAITVQRQLREQLILTPSSTTPQIIAGIDVGYNRMQRVARASIAIISWEGLALVHHVRTERAVDFPYIPGLLAFREIPVILDALALLPEAPGVLMVDGQGIAHPRRMGIAAHLGVMLDMPAIGVAKSRLCGEFEEPGPRKGDQSPLLDGAEQIGTVLRSRNHVRPLFISPGHRMDHHTAVDITMHCLSRYRLPEPTRLADKYSKITHNESRSL